MVSGRLEFRRSAFEILRPGFNFIRPGFKPEPPGRNKPQFLKKAGFRDPFDFKEDPANSQGILNNSATLTFKGRPLLNRVQHYGLGFHIGTQNQQMY